VAPTNPVQALRPGRADWEPVAPTTPAVREIFRVVRPGGRLLVVEFQPPKSRFGRHLVHGGTAHAMAHNRVDLLDGFITDAGFEVRGRGDVRPWLYYVQATRPR
jgi:SAM-dependent methyltransferase